jgi:hypothetical protein
MFNCGVADAAFLLLALPHKNEEATALSKH